MAIDAQERAVLAETVREAASGGPREFLDENGTPSTDVRLWTLLAQQMELAGLLVSADDGGAGAGIAELAVVIEQLAAALAVVPSLSSMGMATALLRVAAAPPASRLLENLASGAVVATVAWPDPQACDIDPVLTCAGNDHLATAIAVTGRADYVLDGMSADVVLVPVRCADATVVSAIDAGAPGVRRSAMTALDLTRGFATIEFSQAQATVMSTDVDLRAALDLALVLVAAEQVGIAQRCHDSAVAWAKQRVQFDRPIGQFQAIKHQLVDLLMALELARSSLDVAVDAADGYLSSPDPAAALALSVAASAAKARCGDAATLVADESLHILGGIGFTWEHDAHLYLRRAKTLEVFLGTPAVHRRRLAAILLEDAGHG